MTRTRRSFIRLAVAAAASAPFIGRFVPSVMASTSTLGTAPTAAPGFYMVNGWILTDADVAALRNYGIRTETISDGTAT